ncbi:MAG: putative succinate dehydrogenase/fumarate reductase related [Chloroflexi bacterium]|nr:putative succinate dehydrogenase/fumarate reductase related [Chloroflexota bacterium]
MSGQRPAAPVATAGPVERRRGWTGWFDPRGRRLGGWAFALNRLTGLGLVAYLYLHLGVLFLLSQGPDGWDAFVDVALSPPILVMDVVLIFGMLLHGLNGIRVGLVGYGMVATRQGALFVGLMIIGAIVLLAATLRVFA